MFQHSLFGECQYGDILILRINRKKIVEEFKKPPEVFSDDDGIKAIDQSNDEDEESFQLYVKTNFPAVFKTFPTEEK